MDDFVLARVVHVLSVVLWIGGVEMVTLILLPVLQQMTLIMPVKGAHRLALAPITQRCSVLTHLLDNLAVNTKIMRNFAFASAFYHHHTSNLHI